MSGNCPAPFEKDLARITLAIRDLYAGRSNASGSFTCTTAAASTTVTAKNCGAKSVISITPTTATAAAELASGNCYISSTSVGSFVVAHTNNATAGRTFNYAIHS